MAMSAGATNPDDVKLLPPGEGGQGISAGASAAIPLPPSSSAAVTVVTSTTPSIPATPSPVASIASRQLSGLPKDELEALAEEFGLEARRFKTPQELVSAIHERRQLIASLDREAMLDVIRWGRRPVPINASQEQIAHEILRIRSMRFEGLSERGLYVLARLRGVPISNGDIVPAVVKKLKKSEGFFARLNRKRRAMLGSIVAKMVGEHGAASEYQFLPPQTDERPGAATATPSPTGVPPPPPRERSIKEEIEESGLFGGIASRVKKTADQYINQKLDEIESRIDRKLDEIDRRLAEWRDKEIANRLRILKITLWASVIVAALSLVYSYIRVYFTPSTATPQQTTGKVERK